MADWFPESNDSLPTDNEMRSLQKWNDQLYKKHGDHGPSFFPEGSLPLPSDSEERSLEKINAILDFVEG